jgi:hypothetical protein
VKDEIGERLNRVVPVCVAVTIRCKAGCRGLLGMIRLAGVQQLRRSIYQIPFCLSHTHTYTFLFNLI